MLDATDTSPIKGRLKERLSFWKDELEASPAILDVIAHGYVLPLKSEPNPYMGKTRLLLLLTKSLYKNALMNCW